MFFINVTVLFPSAVSQLLLAGCLVLCFRQRTWRHLYDIWNTGLIDYFQNCSLRILLTESSLWETKKKFRYILFHSVSLRAELNSVRNRFRRAIMQQRQPKLCILLRSIMLFKLISPFKTNKQTNSFRYLSLHLDITFLYLT